MKRYVILAALLLTKTASAQEAGLIPPKEQPARVGPVLDLAYGMFSRANKTNGKDINLSSLASLTVGYNFNQAQISGYAQTQALRLSNAEYIGLLGGGVRVTAWPMFGLSGGLDAGFGSWKKPLWGFHVVFRAGGEKLYGALAFQHLRGNHPGSETHTLGTIGVGYAFLHPAKSSMATLSSGGHRDSLRPCSPTRSFVV